MSSDQQTIFTNNLRKFIDASGKTQSDIAKDIGVSVQTLNTWAMGKAIPRMNRIQALADYFRIPKSFLLEAEPPAPDETPNRIPVYGSVPAGIPIEAIQDIVDWEDIPMDWLRGGKQYLAFRVKGDSMYPEYLDGDTIIVLRQPDCNSGDDCVVYVNGYDATLKRVIKQQFGIVLQPLNPAYEPQFFDYNDENRPISILGVVVELRRKKH